MIINGYSYTPPACLDLLECHMAFDPEINPDLVVAKRIPSFVLDTAGGDFYENQMRLLFAVRSFSDGQQ